MTASQLSKSAVLILMFSTAVFACSAFPTGAADEFARQADVFAGLGTFLIVANASVLLFLKKRYWVGTLVGLGAILVQAIFVTGTIIFGDSCLDMTHRFVRTEVILLSVLLTVQIGAQFLLRRNARFK